MIEKEDGGEALKIGTTTMCSKRPPPKAAAIEKQRRINDHSVRFAFIVTSSCSQELFSGHDRVFFCFRLTTSTEQGAWLTTDNATLPKRRRLIPVYPCEPMTTRSAAHFSAS